MSLFEGEGVTHKNNCTYASEGTAFNAADGSTIVRNSTMTAWKQVRGVLKCWGAGDITAMLVMPHRWRKVSHAAWHLDGRARLLTLHSLSDLLPPDAIQEVRWIWFRRIQPHLNMDVLLMSSMLSIFLKRQRVNLWWRGSGHKWPEYKTETLCG